MNKSCSVTALDTGGLELTIEDISRYAGGGRYRANAAMQAAMAAARKKALYLASPVCVHSVYSVRERYEDRLGVSEDGLCLPFGPAADDAMDRIAVAILTLGPALEMEVARLNNTGDLIASLFLDAAGVALLNLSANEVVLSVINQTPSFAGYVPSCYRQPGCEGVPMETQNTLFELVDAGAVGVVLTESLVMTPTKSLSFWVEWTRNTDRENAMDKCRNCSLRHCIFRRRGSTTGQ